MRCITPGQLGSQKLHCRVETCPVRDWWGILVGQSLRIKPPIHSFIRWRRRLTKGWPRDSPLVVILRIKKSLCVTEFEAMANPLQPITERRKAGSDNNRALKEIAESNHRQPTISRRCGGVPE
ncbi:hypothetical protein V2G26_005940 [Clonostachys chloroleuca]